jgi:hypothetical protein
MSASHETEQQAKREQYGSRHGTQPVDLAKPPDQRVRTHERPSTNSKSSILNG